MNKDSAAQAVVPRVASPRTMDGEMGAAGFHDDIGENAVNQ